MSSNVFSRFLPPQAGSLSIYDQIREEENAASQFQGNNFAEYDLDERNLNEEHVDYGDEDLDNLLREAGESQITTANSPVSERSQAVGASQARSKRFGKPRWMRGSAHPAAHGEDDDFEPGRLLLEDNDHDRPVHEGPQGLPPPVPGPSSRKSRVQWNAPTPSQETDDHVAPTEDQQQFQPRSYTPFADRKEKAMYRWANVSNLDKFLGEVYDYYVGNGIWSIVLHRMLYLVTLAFVVSLSVFLGACVNYSKIPKSTRLDEILIPQCTQKMSFLSNLFIWLFSAYWIYKLVQFTLDIPRLYQLHDFYLYLLNVEDSEMQTIAWQQIVKRLMVLRESNPATAQTTKTSHREWMERQIGKPTRQRMDAHDIANRLMRKDNYMIALFNKDILDFSLPIAGLRNRQLFSRSIEWNVYACLTDFVFNDQGQVQQLFLKDTSRQNLIEALQRRFIIVGLLNVVAAPFTFVWSLVTFFLRYFAVGLMKLPFHLFEKSIYLPSAQEFRNKPSEIGSRSYTPLAEWKFREFNELQHLFEERKNLSYPFAKHYVDQFPKDKTIQLARFVVFVSGALGAVLAAVSVLDPASFLEFEVTKDRTVLFYLGVFGAIWTAARSMVPDENLVFDPEHAMSQVIYHTHYRPDHWTERLHAEDVRREFSSLYQMKLVIFVEEIFSILAMPFIFWFSLPPCSERLIDFFREFTVHVDGLGYVCSFAVFDFKQGAGQENRTSREEQASNAQHTAATQAAARTVDARSEYYSTKNGKMRDSMMSFRQAYLDPQFAQLRPYAHRAFRTPPAFPGLAQSEQHLRSTSHAGDRSFVRSPAKASQPASPAPSLLLDPQQQMHHSTTATMRKSRHLAQSRYRYTPYPLAEEAEDADEGPSASVMFEEDARAGPSASNLDSHVHDTDQLGEKGGVLGLLTKFTETRGQSGI